MAQTRAFSGTVTTVVTKTFAGNPPSMILVRNRSDSVNLLVQVPVVHGSGLDDFDVIPPGGEQPYRNHAGIPDVKVRGEADASCAYGIAIVIGAV